VSEGASVVDPFVRGNPFFLEKYCSEMCRQTAWQSYHACLCGADFVSDEKRVHPLHHLYNLCVESNRSNPLFIARIFAVVFQRVTSEGRTPEGKQKREEEVLLVLMLCFCRGVSRL
jgi:hypothetical protein